LKLGEAAQEFDRRLARAYRDRYSLGFFSGACPKGDPLAWDSRKEGLLNSLLLEAFLGGVSGSKQKSRVISINSNPSTPESTDKGSPIPFRGTTSHLRSKSARRETDPRAGPGKWAFPRERDVVAPKRYARTRHQVEDFAARERQNLFMGYDGTTVSSQNPRRKSKPRSRRGAAALAERGRS